MPVIQQHAPVPQSHSIPQKDVPASPKPRPQDGPRRPSPPPDIPVKDVVDANILPKPDTKKDELKDSPASLRRSPTPTPASAISKPDAESPPQPSAKAGAKDDDLPDTSNLPLVESAIFDQILELDEDPDERDFSGPMVKDYCNQAVETFDKMDAAVASRNLEELHTLGHFLKGSSAALGLSRVQDGCEKIQHYGSLRDEETKTDLTPAEAHDRIVKTLKRVKLDYDEAKKWLTDFFGDI